MMKILLITFIILQSFGAYAINQRYLMRSPRALLMGDAYTSIATDEYTLYYNPALLARHKGLSFNPFNPSFSVTNALSDAKKFQNLPTEPGPLASQIMGTPIHIGANIAPGLKFGHFGMSGFVNNDTNINLLNQVTPVMEIDHRLDRGFLFGYGHNFWGDLTEEGGEQLSFGMSMKYITREGIFEAYPLLGLGLLSAAQEKDINDKLNALGMAKGKGWGSDFGLDYVKRTSTQEVGVSLAFMDWYSNLKTTDAPSTDPDREVPAQNLDINLGSHWKQDYGIFDMTISADIRTLNDPHMIFTKRFHLGVELGLPVLRVLGGYNTGYYSYGIMTNIFLIDFYLGFYEYEMGEKVGQQKASQFVLYLSLFDFKFDA